MQRTRPARGSCLYIGTLEARADVGKAKTGPAGDLENGDRSPAVGSRDRAPVGSRGGGITNLRNYEFLYFEVTHTEAVARKIFLPDWLYGCASGPDLDVKAPKQPFGVKVHLMTLSFKFSNDAGFITESGRGRSPSDITNSCISIVNCERISVADNLE